LADEFVADAVRGDARGPAHDEGQAVAAFVDVGLGAAVAEVVVVVEGGEGGEVGVGREAVVGGKDDEGVFGESGGVERGEDLGRRCRQVGRRNRRRGWCGCVWRIRGRG
jgi:hypothetical protein